ncbi:MAG: hypothetical protein AMS18_10620 [Gemmatimonas sp. SG8_17]|nr:MAG: hypothetical protein AMS18_10620 [Gemmatimonas sp. SG8_17]
MPRAQTHREKNLGLWMSTSLVVGNMIGSKEQFNGTRLVGSSVIAVLAFLYSLWAIAGAGRDMVYLGLLLLLAGIPVYVWIVWRRADTAEDVTR